MGEISNFEDEECYGFRIDVEQRKAKAKEELQKGIEGDEYTISTDVGDMEEWKEANAKLGEKKR